MREEGLTSFFPNPFFFSLITLSWPSATLPQSGRVILKCLKIYVFKITLFLFGRGWPRS
jgi:hypothetical protein